VIGGGAVTQQYCNMIEADGYSRDGTEAVKLVREFTK